MSNVADQTFLKGEHGRSKVKAAVSVVAIVVRSIFARVVGLGELRLFGV